jgi:hypothetical protein
MPKIGSRSKISQQQQQTEKMFQHHPESTTPKKKKKTKKNKTKRTWIIASEDMEGMLEVTLPVDVVVPMVLLLADALPPVVDVAGPSIYPLLFLPYPPNLPTLLP